MILLRKFIKNKGSMAWSFSFLVRMSLANVLNVKFWNIVCLWLYFLCSGWFYCLSDDKKFFSSQILFKSRMFIFNSCCFISDSSEPIPSGFSITLCDIENVQGHFYIWVFEHNGKPCAKRLMTFVSTFLTVPDLYRPFAFLDFELIHLWK